MSVLLALLLRIFLRSLLIPGFLAQHLEKPPIWLVPCLLFPVTVLGEQDSSDPCPHGAGVGGSQTVALVLWATRQRGGLLSVFFLAIGPLSTHLSLRPPAVHPLAEVFSETFLNTTNVVAIVGVLGHPGIRSNFLSLRRGGCFRGLYPPATCGHSWSSS